MEFEFAMDLQELQYRTNKEHYKPIKLLSRTSQEVKHLSHDDLMVFKHLVRASKFIDDVSFKLENHKNQEILDFLNKEIKNGSEQAKLTKKLFLSQKSIFSPDANGEQTVLFKGIEKTDGLGYFPEDLKEKEFHNILNKMLDDGLYQEVKDILSQRTVVVRDNKYLKAIDFTQAFPEFSKAAQELEKASEFCVDDNFKKYLLVQAKALKTADDNLDAKADKVWAMLDENCKFEFTITRECYDEKLTQTIFENDELKSKLEKLDITIYAKDSIGARVGIVNRQGTELLIKLKELMSIARKNMPFCERYEQENTTQDFKQTAVDVDLIALTGDEGAYRASIVLAQNLPNDDKLSVKTGGGRRNVYHRQVRQTTNKKLYKNLITKEFFKYFEPEADHWAVICHENTHSLGPRNHKDLGKFSPIIEEFKADMGMFAFLDEFKAAGYFSDKQCKQIMVTALAYGFLKGKPELHQAHRVRSVMICNRLISTGAVIVNINGMLEFDFEKIKQTTKLMLKEVVELQLEGNVKKASEYVKQWFVWTDTLERVATTIKSFSKKLNGYLIMPLAKQMLNKNFK